MPTTWNPADKTTDCVLSNGNLTARSNNFGFQCTRSIYSTATGKHYWECTFVDFTNNACGIANLTAAIGSFGTGPAASTGAAFVNSAGSIVINGSSSVALPSFPAGRTACIALDLTAQRIWFRNGASGQWNNSGTADPATGAGGLAVSFVGAGTVAAALYSTANATPTGVITANFGASAFVGVVPSGFPAGFPGTAAAVAQARVMVLA